MPIIYSHVDHLRKGELGPWLRTVVSQPYILITGQSDWAIPSSTDNAEQVRRREGGHAYHHSQPQPVRL